MTQSIKCNYGIKKGSVRSGGYYDIDGVNITGPAQVPRVLIVVKTIIISNFLKGKCIGKSTG